MMAAFALVSLLACSRSRAPDKLKTGAAAAAKASPARSQPNKIGEGSMFSGRPYVTLKIEAQLIQYDVFVNGAPILTDYSGAPSNETMPVNQALRSGPNELQLLVVPWELEPGKVGYHEDARVRLVLQVQESGALDQPAREVASLEFHGNAVGEPAVTIGSSAVGAFDSARDLGPSSTGDVRVSAPRLTKLDADNSLLVERTIDLPMPLLEWEFLRSDVVPTTYAATEKELEKPYEELMRAYEVIWNGLKSRNLDAIMPLFEERSRNVDRAFYFPPGTTQEKLRASFQSALDDSSQELAPLRPKSGGSWNYEVAPTGRLMRLVRGEHSSAIIRFEDKKDASYRTTYPITFRKRGDSFIVAL